MEVTKKDVVRIITAAASGPEMDDLLALAGEKPGLWDGLQEEHVMGVLKAQLRKEGSSAGEVLAAAP